MSRRFSPRLKAVLFDLDGTLLDTAPDFIEVIGQLRDEHGLPELPPGAIRSCVSNGARALVTLSLGLRADEPGFEEQRRRLLELYAAALGRHTRVYEGMAELLLELHSAGIAWGVATNKHSAYAAPLLAGLDLRPPCASLVCPDHVARSKPDPESLLLNCRQLDCRPGQAIYIGDHPRDIQAGAAAGMATIAAAYGYLEAGQNPRDWGADAVAERSRDLAASIASLLH